jgi:hypothetical protein
MDHRARLHRREFNRRGAGLRAAVRVERACAPIAERLERRLLFSAFTVTTLADSGAGSLRDAITSAERAGGAQTINFTPGLAGTIDLQSALPEITTSLTFNGPGANLLAINAEQRSGVLAFEFGVNAQLNGLTITGGFASNYAPDDPFADGGGIRNFGNLTITDCSIVQNFSQGFTNGSSVKGGFGGGIYNSPGATLTLVNSNVSNNNVANGHEEGGGICNFSGALVVVNSTISGNTANQSGAGIFSTVGITVIDSTISGNISAGQNNASGSGFGSGIFSYGQSTLDGDIVAENTGKIDLYAPFNAPSGTFVGSNDLIGVGSGDSALTASIFNANPLLGPLANNGGATETMAFLAGSPAVGKNGVFAQANGVDQRGEPRVPSFIDIGAFQSAEAPGPSLVVTNLNDSGAGSLRQAILTADADNQTQTIGFAPGLTGTINLASPLPALTANTCIAGPGAPVLTVDGNSKGSDFLVTSGAIATIENLTITGGSADYGGGIDNQSSLTISNAIITANKSSIDGGGIYSSGPLTVTTSTISGNSSSAGGGMFSDNTATILNSTVSGNSAGFAGGGIYQFSQQFLNVTDCTITGNSTPGEGGGIYGNSGSVDLVNSTITGNGASEGGGVMIGFMFVTDCTVSGNSGPTCGGIAGAGLIEGTIVAANSGPDMLNTSQFNSFSGDHNLIGDGSDAADFTMTLAGTAMAPLNPKLGVLLNNGGPTETEALLPGSPAIGAGALLVPQVSVDQRGQPRTTSSGVDIGAYQSGIVVNTLVDPTIFLNGVVSLRRAIEEAQSLGNNQIITFAAGLTGSMNLNSSLPAVTTFLTIAGPGVNVITVNGQSHSPVFTINSGQTLVMQNLTITGGAIADNGTLDSLGDVIAGPITGTGALAVGAAGQYSRLTLATNSGASTQSSVTVNSGSTLDITNNRFIINFGAPAADPISTIQSLLTTGYNSGAWTGTGIDSSTAAAGSSGEKLAVGYADGNTDAGTPAQPNQIVLKYTLAGDANLDGLVNFQDLVAVVQNFNKVADWGHGNADYNATTNFQDLVTVVQNLNKVLNPPASSAEQVGNTVISLVQSLAAPAARAAVSLTQNAPPKSPVSPDTDSGSSTGLFRDDNSADSILAE